MTAMGAWIYFGARAAYLPLYLFGVAYLRTAAWFASLCGLTLILWQLI